MLSFSIAAVLASPKSLALTCQNTGLRIYVEKMTRGRVRRLPSEIPAFGRTLHPSPRPDFWCQTFHVGHNRLCRKLNSLHRSAKKVTVGLLTFVNRSGRLTENVLSTTSTPGTESMSLTAMLAGMSVTESECASSAPELTMPCSCVTCLSALLARSSSTSTLTMSSTTPVPSLPTDSPLV